MLDKSKIELLNNCLHNYCNPLFSRLLPPLKQEEIIFYFQKWGIDDENLFDFFLWKNGIAYDDQLPTLSFDFTGFGVIPPLKFIDKIITIESPNPYWSKSLMPFVASYAGDFLLYETSKQSINYGQLFLYSPNLGYVDYQVGYFDSLETMIDTIVENFEKKIMIYNYEEMLLDVLDYDKRFEISKTLNPKSEYWQ